MHPPATAAAAAVSILYHALIDKKSEFCRLKMVLVSKQLLWKKHEADECAERILALDELLSDLYDNEHDVSEEISVLQEEQAHEEAAHVELVAAVDEQKALLRRLVHRQARLDACRKSITHRQRRIVERAFRLQVARNPKEMLSTSAI
ncbi:Aste57867_17015 [Aphanomyces stellatus]|uniref:Aste57867_17015 protein n=1 Tax=Aphanomyces stellatus TaxID=120398 RepID=A0A485L6W4_9STRA|nr:hypothetical protein As57867_016957 [Aphanomyces stellatus]VFT93776.1 Aste57867_17015 [Aphanomyces stellatus]